jgi:hypothetical protein
VWDETCVLLVSSDRSSFGNCIPMKDHCILVNFLRLPLQFGADNVFSTSLAMSVTWVLFNKEIKVVCIYSMQRQGLIPISNFFFW